MSHPREADLEALTTAKVEFIVVEGAAAVLHGAPTSTQDLDIVHRRTDENVSRFFQLRPRREHMAGPGQLSLSTALGPLDPLGTLHDGRGYDELLAHTVLMEDGAVKLRVLNLDTLISIKASTGRNKDKLLVPVLVALRREPA